MIERELIKRAKSATVVIGYYVPKGTPQWLGTAFLAGNETSALTCLHVVENRPLCAEDNGQKIELSSWLFWHLDDKKCHIVKLPITEILGWNFTKRESTYYSPERPDVAYLKLNPQQWVEKYNDSPLPSLEVEADIKNVEVGDEIMVVGYPAPYRLMTQENGDPNALEPLVQFGKIAGILPASSAPLPHALALDMISTPGSSGSPVVRVSDGKVIGMISGGLLNVWRQKVIESTPDNQKLSKELAYAIPTGIAFALPSNLFAHYATLPGGKGHFEVNSRW